MNHHGTTAPRSSELEGAIGTNAKIAIVYGLSRPPQAVSFDSFNDLLSRCEKAVKDCRNMYQLGAGLELVLGCGSMPEDPTEVDRLLIGMCDTEWVLLYMPSNASGSIPLASLGDADAVGVVPFDFGQHSEILRQHLIPSDIAKHALRDWIERGLLSHEVNWVPQL